MVQDEKVAIITGGGRGIGAATGLRFLEAGFHVYFADMNFKRVQELIASHKDETGRAHPLEIEVTSDMSVDRAINYVGEKHGHIDVLINNAGITNQKSTQDIPTAEWQQMIDIHLGGTFRCSRAAFPYLKAANGASIINVSSIAGRMGMPIRASYCAAKAGIEGLTRSLATEWAEYGIRVNAVAPGWVMTELIQKDLENGLVSEAVLSARISLKRFGKPEEISEVIFFLAVDSSSYMTGQVLNVDGGLSIDLNPGSTLALSTKE
jgi:NAD(P)-dependent dehydrogenase (short-subunit alcohol dehydrogenase family)